MPHNSTTPTADEVPDDPHCRDLAGDVLHVLEEAQSDFSHKTLSLDTDQLTQLAGILAEFAIDLHKDIGIWRVFEDYNREFFDTPLPVTPSPDSTDRSTTIHQARVQHLLWVIYPVLEENLVLSPTHPDLESLAGTVASFLSEATASLPTDSPVRDFFEGPNTYGWDVKKKLIWLGTESYMFRRLYEEYLREEEPVEDPIGVTDDFLCQECTRWSGLGAIDILARVLDISEEDRRDLRGWYERHAALYEVLRSGTDIIELRNHINDERYTVRMNMEDNPFKKGMFLFGSLVPWRGEWYWSGSQRAWQEMPGGAIEDVCRQMRQQKPQVVCRYDEDYRQRVIDSMRRSYREMMDYYGTDLVYFPDGQSLASAMQSEFEKCNQARIEERDADPEKVPQAPDVKSSFPPELLESRNGIALFLNPEEGREIMRGYDDVLSGLKKQGDNLDRDEQEIILAFVESDSISPRFVRRVVEEHGCESILTAWHIPRKSGRKGLDYLLRSQKGHFFRNRYPALGIVDALE